MGRGPEPVSGSAAVLLVHGVGLGSVGFERLVSLAEQRGMTVAALDRRGYDGRTPTADLDVHVEDLAEHVDEMAAKGRPVVVAGVSGGATLTLALAAGDRTGLLAAVVHEPLIGPAASVQHEVITGSISRLQTDRTDTASDEPNEPRTDDVEQFMTRLMTPQTWGALSDVARMSVVAHAAAVRVEVDGFAQFALDGADLEAAAARTVWTVGRRSPDWRKDAAAIARRHGMRVRPVDAVHTPQVESPGEWLDVIQDAIESAGCGR